MDTEKLLRAKKLVDDSRLITVVAFWSQVSRADNLIRCVCTGDQVVFTHPECPPFLIDTATGELRVIDF